MNNRVNYTLVGVLVAVAIALMLVFVYWLLKPSYNQDLKKYYIHFNESVLGLNIDAPVKYRGISVGKVTSLEINPNNIEQVEVIITIFKTTPIKTDTVAKLTAQGITGLSYINLSKGSENAKELIAKNTEKYPSIKTIPSFLKNFEETIGSVSNNLSSTLVQAEKLLNDDNQKQVTILLRKTASIMEKVDRILDEKTIKHIQSSAKNIDNFSSKIDKITPDIDYFIDKSIKWEDKISTSFNSIMVSYLGIRSSMDEIKRAISSGEFNIKEISADIIPTLNNTLLSMQELIIRVDNVLEKYERSPRDMLFKEEKPRLGPGEGR
jgi:phospholipid/cholesterol/gamma-HCH transport system substrate-binding protein